VQARIWVKRTVWLSTTPAAFNWSGLFDGASVSSEYGYASILPKTAGAFYMGLGSSANTWAGPFRIVLQDNSLNTNYAKDQFMEFSVNLSKLGLDPAGLLGGDICGTPFNRIVVKTRASASFTAELKDFVAPTDLFLAPRVDIITETPYICDTIGVARIEVRNPQVNSYYEWTTPNGHILMPIPAIGTYIIVDTPGIYICHQRLQAGCSIYASDTIEIFPFLPCGVLSGNLYDVTGHERDGKVRLTWKVMNNEVIDHFEIERSTDGFNFSGVGFTFPYTGLAGAASFMYVDSLREHVRPVYYYRLKFEERHTSRPQYSQVIRISPFRKGENSLLVLPNPVKNVLQVDINVKAATNMKAYLYDAGGKLLLRVSRDLQAGNNVITLDEFSGKHPGVYTLVVAAGEQLYSRKLMVVH
jgi:hypothetical protein